MITVMTSLSAKIQTFIHSFATYGVVVATVITAIMLEASTADWFPEDAAGQVVKWGTVLIGVIASATKVLQSVTPVPKEGLEVTKMNGETEILERGW